jgi:hypothetical protein
MRGLVNDCLRWIIGWAIVMFGWVSTGLLHLRILSFSRNQKRLKRKYGITTETPVLPYGPTVTNSIHTVASKLGRSARFARTSGSMGEAKQILYTGWRLLALKFTFSDMFARASHAFKIRRTCLYVFNSFEKDISLTSLLLAEHKLPNYTSTLQAPYRVQHHPAIQLLVSQYGPAAVRLWVLTLSNPGVLYSTNPSTISTFLDELASEWRRSSKLIKDWHENPSSFSCELHKIAHRLESRDAAKRIKQIALSAAPLPLSVCAPAVEAYICWTGGYVRPFLDRLARHLPSLRYRLIPMYSMSTETIETLPYFRGEEVGFLPLGGGVVYEFLEATAMDHLLNAHALEPGKLYAMVVSNGYGLRRYQTDDLFLCRRKISGLPDLVFVRRRSLEYSFTGEKLTGEQLSTVFEQLRVLYPSLVDGKFLTCVPSQPQDAVPHYKVLVVGAQSAGTYDLLAARCDELLSDINCEYKSKRASGRLGAVSVSGTSTREFAEQLAANGNWETQFKFMPLYPHVLPASTPVLI